MARIYVVGDIDEGITFIKLTPPKIVVAKKSAIQAIAKEYGYTYREVFAAIGYLAKQLIEDNRNSEAKKTDKAFEIKPAQVQDGIHAALLDGMSMSDVEFVFTANLSTFAIIQRRRFFAIMKPWIEELEGKEGKPKNPGKKPAGTRASAPRR
jgi:hypothetical protein